MVYYTKKHKVYKCVINEIEDVFKNPMDMSRELTPKSILLDLLGVAFPKPVLSQHLWVIADIFSVPENNLRVAMTRLVASGWVSSDVRGEYHLSEKARARNQFIRNWKAKDKQKPWQQGWLACHLPKGAGRSERAKSIKALEWYGFKLGLDLMWVRPDNLAIPKQGLLNDLRLLGLEANAPLFVLQDIDPPLTSSWLQLWPTEDMDKVYQAMTKRLRASEKKPEAKRSLLETCVLGGEAIHYLVKDPQLPQSIHARKHYDQLKETMIRYDQMGRSIWFSELENLGVSA